MRICGDGGGHRTCCSESLALFIQYWRILRLAVLGVGAACSNIISSVRFRNIPCIKLFFMEIIVVNELHS